MNRVFVPGLLLFFLRILLLCVFCIYNITEKQNKQKGFFKGCWMVPLDCRIVIANSFTAFIHSVYWDETRRGIQRVRRTPN